MALVPWVLLLPLALPLPSQHPDRPRPPSTRSTTQLVHLQLYHHPRSTHTMSSSSPYPWTQLRRADACSEVIGALNLQPHWRSRWWCWRCCSAVVERREMAEVVMLAAARLMRRKTMAAPLRTRRVAVRLLLLMAAPWSLHLCLCPPGYLPPSMLLVSLQHLGSGLPTAMTLTPPDRALHHW